MDIQDSWIFRISQLSNYPSHAILGYSLSDRIAITPSSQSH